jgi:uncharacterized membrane protein YgdD (TMEM256/DUF423 family)
MKPAHWIFVASVLGFLAVALGAFGAHALSSRFGDYEKGLWQTAVQYHLAHAILLFAYGCALNLSDRSTLTAIASEGHYHLVGALFAGGIVIFSGSLYALALSGVRVLGAITPIGGVCFLVGWALLARLGLLLANR